MTDVSEAAANAATARVADALAQVAKWKADEESRHNTELSEVDQEVASLQTAIENLKQQLEALGRFRQELLGKLETVQTAVPARTYDAVFAVLLGQMDALGGRAEELLEKERARDAALLGTLDDPAVKNLLAEYEQFQKAIAPTLDAMPATYREAMEKLRDSQRAQLAEKLGDLGREPVASDGGDVYVDVLVAVDAPEGSAEVLMLVLPVSEDVQVLWSDREEDVQTHLTARVMQGTYAATEELGYAGAEAVFGGHQGLLAIEIEVGGGDPDAVVEKVRGQIQASLDGAPELEAGKVRVRVQVVDVDHLLPPEPTEVEVE